ncbi:hypothetical protein GEMRC1_007813 [Eukaryota sp. GEM-RC1]
MNNIAEIKKQISLERQRLDVFLSLTTSLISDCKSGILQLKDSLTYRQSVEAVQELQNTLFYKHVFFHSDTFCCSLECPVCGCDLFYGFLDFLNHVTDCNIKITSFKHISDCCLSSSITSDVHPDDPPFSYPTNPKEPLFSITSGSLFPKMIRVIVTNTAQRTTRNSFFWIATVTTYPESNLITRVVYKLDRSFLVHTSIRSTAPFLLEEEGYHEFTLTLMVEFEFGTPLFIDHHLSLSCKEQKTIQCCWLWI